jgi:hypothetical protein
MAEQAAHLVDAVLPWVPVRQWVLTVPHRLRYRLAFDHALCRAVLGVFVRAVLGWYRRRARRTGIADGRSGTVTVVQRFGSGLELNVHFHALGLDGVFAASADGSLRFHLLPPPTDADIARLVAAIARRIGRLLVRRGLTADADAADPLAAESLALAGLASAAVQGRLAFGPRAGARVERLGGGPDAPWVESSRPLQARCAGCDLHAGVTVAGEDRHRLEQLCRYLLRPPIAQDPGRAAAVTYGQPKQRVDRPHDLAPTAAAAPFARPTVAATTETDAAPAGATAPLAPEPAASISSAANLPPTGPSPVASRPTRRGWADLLHRVFAVDVLACPNCGGRMRVIATIDDPRVVRRILRHLGLLDDPGPPPEPPAWKLA